MDSYAVRYLLRRHRVTGALVRVRMVHGRSTGAVPVLVGMPPELFEIPPNTTELGEEAMGLEYEAAPDDDDSP